MRRRRVTNWMLLALTATALIVAGESSALGSVASITADLQHPSSDVPSPTVTLATTPNADESEAGPGPALRVTMRPPVGSALDGILVPNDATPFYTTTLPHLVRWDLAILQAAKHARDAGQAIDSISITREFQGLAAPGQPDLLIALPPGESAPSVPAPMSTAEVTARVRASLPAWAGVATVEVIDDFVGERVVTAKLDLARAVFPLIRPSELTDALIEQQHQLTVEGAKIGRVVAEISDPTSEQPLYAGGADGFLGFRADWHSPLVQGFAGGPPDTSVDPESVLDSEPDNTLDLLKKTAGLSEQPRASGYASSTCEGAPAGQHQEVMSAGNPDAHLWLGLWQESTTRAHVCLRVEADSESIGGMLTLDGAGAGVTPTIADDFPCEVNVISLGNPLAVEVKRSGSPNPASLCVKQGATEKRITLEAGADGAVATWTPDPDTPLGPLP